ncbi:thymidine phosphorylase [Auritidibacter ignavus]|uniref:thymidine phosphorylase n=1 Tax=Auritidibacter ignavus TaxID=678932 RepID=UPI00244A87C4|nr:thymidine phosphorylase [Auritidibacter ignavus]WGH84922.1 thymidine phosphorylase [Auritidibacter ignavus]
MTSRHFHPVELIATKRDGEALTTEAITWIIERYTAGGLPDEQMSALLMSIYYQGLNAQELHAWTQAMINSGTRMDFSTLGHPTADKHSTGGVGDKITLVLTPLVASYGVAVPQLSGRGLGHTGGTLDKLESIPGYRVNLTPEEMTRQLKDIRAVICAPTAALAPADQKIYALRDATATVESIPLIASSIMSKKIAEGTDSLVLDVKVGSGAFMKDLGSARTLAHTLVRLGTAAQVNTTALVTDMSTPLGRTVGNALEVEESLEVLSGGGPQDVRDLTVALATEMLRAAGITGVDPAEHLDSGAAMDTFAAMVSAQGGDLRATLPTAHHEHQVVADRSGSVTSVDALTVGLIARRLGAGRAQRCDAVQAGAGVRLHVRRGDSVTAGQPVATFYTDDTKLMVSALELTEQMIEIGPDATDTTVPDGVILDRISN